MMSRRTLTHAVSTALLLLTLFAGSCTTAPDTTPAAQSPPVLPPAWMVIKWIEAGDLRAVRWSLDRGLPVESADEMGRPLLHHAIFHKHPEIVRLLLDRGADPDATHSGPHHIKLPAHYATTGGATEILHILVRAGATLDAPSAAAAGDASRLARLLDDDPALLEETWYFHPNSGERTLLGLASLHGAVPTIRLLIDRGMDPLEPNGDDFTPLYMAAAWGRAGAVRELLKHDPRVNRANEWGWTPIIVAASGKHDEVFDLLVEHGADYGLHAAALRDDVHRIDELLAGDKPVDLEAKVGDRTALMQAARKGHLAAATRLLDAGARMDHINTWHGPALSEAAWYGHVDMVKLLLDRGCDPDIGSPDDAYGRALHRAAWQGHLDIIKLLLDRGASLETVDNTRETPLFFAVKQDRLDAVALLLQRGAKVDARSEGRSTPLHAAAWQGHTRVAALLIEHGADVHAMSKHSGTALHIAANRGYRDLCELLLNHPPDRTLTDVDDKTPLHLVVEWKHTPARKADALATFDLLLARGYDLETRSRAGYTVLHRVIASRSDLDMVERVLEAGADINAVSDKGYTALHLATMHRAPEKVRVLLDHGATINVRNDKGLMPQHTVINDDGDAARQIMAMFEEHTLEMDIYAFAQIGDLETVRTMLRADPKAIHRPGAGGKRLLQIAAERGDLDMVEFLLKHRPAPKVDATTSGGSGWSALHAAAAAGHTEVVKRLIGAGADVNQAGRFRQAVLFSAAMHGNPEGVRMLIEAGADVNASNSYGYTPLMQAAEGGHTEAARLLLEAEARVHQTTRHGDTALSHALTRSGDLELVTLLIDHGADVNSDTDTYSPPLHDIAAHGSPELFELLIEAGAEVNRRNERGDTALDWALSNGNRRGAAVLQAAGGKRGHELTDETTRGDSREP